MNKKVIIICLGILIVLVGGLCFFLKEDEKDSELPNDALTFKQEYENYNGKTNDNGDDYPVLEISENSGVTYVTEAEVVDILKNKNGIIYFGFPSCPWCRNSLPILLNALENNDVKKFYYLNILDIRSTYVLNDDNEAIKTKDGSDYYYEILSLLDKELSEYELSVKDKNGKVVKSVKTGEKRLYAPSVVFVRDGVIVDIHVGTVSSQTNPYLPMTKEEKEELNDIYTKAINKVFGESCEEEC